MNLKIIWSIAISAVLILLINGIDDSWALKSKGVTQSTILSDKICGIDFCGSSQGMSEKISDYLGNIAKSSNSEFDYEELNQKVPHIIKTRILNGDLRLIQYSDGNWELTNRSALVEGLYQSQSESGDVQMEFGGMIDLSSGLDKSKSVGSLSIN